MCVDLEILNGIVKDALKGSDDTFDFISELKNYVEEIKDNKQKEIQKNEIIETQKQNKIEKEKEKTASFVYVPLEKIQTGNSNGIEDMLLYSSKIQGKIIAKYRDEMLQERRKILEIYAKNTAEKGEMYYIYNKEKLELNEDENYKTNINENVIENINESKNHKTNESKNLNENNVNQIIKEGNLTENSNLNKKSNVSFNLTNCSAGKSSVVLKMNENELPEGVKLGTVLRKNGDEFIIDEKATEEVEKAIYSAEIEKLKEQRKFLQEKRIEGHIYQIAEKTDKTAFLFDVTGDKENLTQSQAVIIPKGISVNENLSNNDEENEINIKNNQESDENLNLESINLNNSNENEAFEEIKFTKKFLKACNEGDFIIYKNGKYQKY